jgi:uncharacterized lipoprotein YehR (DUF1307 family)
MNEIKETIEHMKKDINKDMETLKISIWNKQLNITNKNRNQKLGEKSGEAGNRLSGIEDKIEELDQTVKDH